MRVGGTETGYWPIVPYPGRTPFAEVAIRRQNQLNCFIVAFSPTVRKSLSLLPTGVQPVGRAAAIITVLFGPGETASSVLVDGI